MEKKKKKKGEREIEKKIVVAVETMDLVMYIVKLLLIFIISFCIELVCVYYENYLLASFID